MAYVETNWTAIETFQDLMGIANTNTSGWFWSGMIVMIFFILVITMGGGFGIWAGILSATFVSLVLALLLAYMELVPWWIVGGFVGVLLATIMYVIWSNRYD